jgi:hypothetical protein
MLPTVAKALAGGGGEGGITVKRASLCFTVIPLGVAEQQNPLQGYAALFSSSKQQ